MTSVHVFGNKANYINTSATAITGSYVVKSILSARTARVPDVTTILSPNGIQASINWKDNSFNINGHVLGLDDLRFKVKSPGSLFTKRWSYNKISWHIKYQYDAKAWQIWRLNGDTAEEQTSAEFKLYKSKLIGDSVPATITFNPSVSESDALFLLMALIYSEVTEHPPPSLSRGFSDNVARAIAATSDILEIGGMLRD
ncbi:hypothetical protein DXG01_006861 [Tephrocybe rancida]|nr:hypothetical protein DXG01_006861 [Tephrocybe rancida]